MSDLQEGFDLLSRNEFDEAREIFESHLQIHSDDPDALFGLARTWDCNCDFDRFMHLTDLEKARKIYEELLSMEEWNIDAIYYLCRVLIQLGEFKEAMEKVDMGLSIDGTNPDLLSTKGMLLYDLEDYDGARQYQLQALSQSGASSFLSELALSVAVEDSVKAEQLFRLAIEIDPEASWAFRNLAQLLAEENRWAEAIDCGQRYFEAGGMEIDMEDLIKIWKKKV